MICITLSGVNTGNIEDFCSGKIGYIVDFTRGKINYVVTFTIGRLTIHM